MTIEELIERLKQFPESTLPIMADGKQIDDVRIYKDCDGYFAHIDTKDNESCEPPHKI